MTLNDYITYYWVCIPPPFPYLHPTTVYLQLAKDMYHLLPYKGARLPLETIPLEWAKKYLVMSYSVIEGLEMPLSREA